MTLEQFKEALLNQGYKFISENCMGAFYTTLKKRNKTITIQEFDEHTNVFYEKQIKGGSIELNQHSITDFAKALNKINTFERKIA